MTDEHEQEAGDDLPTLYRHLAENRRILQAHEREQDALEAEVDMEYMIAPCWIRDR